MAVKFDPILGKVREDDADGSGTDLTGLMVDNAIARGNGTGTVQSSGVLIDDSNNITGVVGITANPDVATDFVFGQVALTDNVGDNWATMAHYDYRNTTGWAFSQFGGAGASAGKSWFNGNSAITDALAFASGQSSRWNLEGVGHWRPSANNAYDFCSASFRLRAIYIGTQVDFAGGMTFNRTTSAAGNYTALVTDYIIAKTGITGGGDTITLPAAATAGEGRQYIIKDESGTAATNNITIDGSGSETIDGSLTVAINQNYGSVNIYTDGSNWFIT